MRLHQPSLGERRTGIQLFRWVRRHPITYTDSRPVTPVLQRPFQNVGELGYAYNPVTGNTLDFRTSGSSDAALLDFFTYNTTDNTATYDLRYPLRAGPVNINTRNSAVIAALLTGPYKLGHHQEPVFPPAPRRPLLR